MNRRWILMTAAVAGVFLGGCVAPPPASFVRFREPGWTTTEIRRDVSYERAWNAMVSLLLHKFDIEYMAREEGYIRTAWTYNWTGVNRTDYRVRVSVKFAEDRQSMEIKPDAQYRVDGDWVSGADTRLLPSLKEDVIRAIGIRL